MWSVPCLDYGSRRETPDRKTGLFATVGVEIKAVHCTALQPTLTTGD